LVPTLAGLIHVGIQFPLYEFLKMKRVREGKVDEPKMLDILIASSLSKLTASAVAYPHEVLRSRLQGENSFF
jgi:solute carrier family 25 (mitochondrial folate transporter), member 32